MKHTTEQAKEIMLSLYQQLGGRWFVTMTGSKFWGYSEDEQGNLQQLIKLVTNESLANRLLITYKEGQDLYSMKFTNQIVDSMDLSCQETEIYNVEDIFGDMLQSIFTQITGLYTHF